MRRRRRRIDKATAQLKHAKRRALQRYGLELDQQLHDRIVAMISTGPSTLVRRQSLRVSVHDVVLDDERVRVVYDRNRHALVTFLPPDQHDEEVSA